MYDESENAILLRFMNWEKFEGLLGKSNILQEKYMTYLGQRSSENKKRQN